MVNNAFIHGRGAIQLRLALRRGRLRIDVVDEGVGAEIRLADGSLNGGNGLRVVDQLGLRWGVHEGSTHVWAELALPQPAPAALVQRAPGTAV